MTALIIRLPKTKRERLKDLARSRKQSVTKLFANVRTPMCATCRSADVGVRVAPRASATS